MTKKIGTIIHGALGDCYEQLWSIRELRKQRFDEKWIGFFAVKNRYDSMKHFELDMLDEVYLANEIRNIDIDSFYQFQINDNELRLLVIDPLPINIKQKFDFKRVNKPWHQLRKHDFIKSPSFLLLSESGKEYLPECMKYNEVSDELFKDKFTIGFLWRYRDNVGGAKSYFNRSKEWVLKTKNELFNRLIDDYGSHIIVAGMSKDKSKIVSLPDEIRQKAAFVEGEYRCKVAEDLLDIPAQRSTFLKGLGYAQEMEIMSKCDILLVMPSGFSEPLWMRYPKKTILVDPISLYSMKVLGNRMPLYQSKNREFILYNYFTSHTASNVIKFLKKQGLLK